MLNYNLIGNIIGWPMFISGILMFCFWALQLWAFSTDYRVKYMGATITVPFKFLALVLLWTFVGIALIWGIK